MLPPVIKTITVPCPPNRAFEIFTGDLAVWWPADKHSVSAMSGNIARSVNAEAAKGGKIWEIDHTGARIDWGSFLDFDPHSHIRIAWHINQPASKATEVAVRFDAQGTGTKVTLTHSGWEILGEAAENTRNGYNGGWVHVFEEKYKAACQ